MYSRQFVTFCQNSGTCHICNFFNFYTTYFQLFNIFHKTIQYPIQIHTSNVKYPSSLIECKKCIICPLGKSVLHSPLRCLAIHLPMTSWSLHKCWIENFSEWWQASQRNDGTSKTATILEIEAKNLRIHEKFTHFTFSPILNFQIRSILISLCSRPTPPNCERD